MTQKQRRGMRRWVSAWTGTSAAAGMMQSGKMNQDMMQSEEMQKQCGEMMKNRVDDTKKEPVVSATSEQDHNAHRQI